MKKTYFISAKATFLFSVEILKQNKLKCNTNL